MPADYDAAVAELYQAPHASFVAERKRLAGELKAAGDKAGAAAFAKLGRPTISAWVVNQLWWHARDAFSLLLASAARLRDGDLAANADHRDALHRLKTRAAAMLAEAGHGATESTLRRVAQTLAAIAATGSWEPDPAGALATDRDPPGFDAAMLAPTITSDAAEAAQRIVAQTEETQRKAAQVAREAVAMRERFEAAPVILAPVIPIRPPASPARASTSAPAPSSAPVPTSTSEPAPSSAPVPTSSSAPAPSSAPVPTSSSAPVPTSSPASVPPPSTAGSPPSAPPPPSPPPLPAASVTPPGRREIAAELRIAKADLAAKEQAAEELRARLAEAKAEVTAARTRVDQLQAELDED